ncbi:MAG: ROK family protein, partial [Planctomycetota bacterium]
IQRAKRKTNAEEGRDAVLTRIVSGVNECCEAAGVAVTDAAAAGIGVPGPVDDRRGVVIEAVNLRWANEPVGDLLSEKLKIPVTLDNDVNVAVYGEWKNGAGRGSDNLLGAWIGTGIGGAFVLDGRLYSGHFKTAGEIGHMPFAPFNPPGTRSLEQTASRTAIHHRLRRLIETNRPSLLVEITGGDLGKIKSRHIAEAFRKGDELTIEVINDAAERLGYSLAGLVTALSLHRLILGGGLTEALGTVWVESVRAAVQRTVFPVTCRAVEVVATELEDNAGVVGAAALARERLVLPNAK